MTDEETTNNDAPQQEMPEMNSYEVTITRAFEQDFSQKQLRMMVKQSEATTFEEAIEQMFLSQEQDNIDAAQKLLGLNVNVDGPSDD